SSGPKNSNEARIVRSATPRCLRGNSALSGRDNAPQRRCRFPANTVVPAHATMELEGLAHGPVPGRLLAEQMTTGKQHKAWPSSIRCARPVTGTPDTPGHKR